MTKTERNWAGNLTYGAAVVVEPETVSEVQECVACADRIKGLGTRHSFSPIADTSGVLLSTRRLNRILGIHHDTGQVEIESGVTYGQLGPALDQVGIALPNLASLPHLSVAGACATGTHGSGNTQQVLTSAVVEMDIVRADGSLWTVKRSDPEFSAVAVHLGLVGIVTRLVLQGGPSVPWEQRVYLRLPLERALDHFDDVTSGCESVSLFTQMREPVFDQVWVKQPVGVAQRFAFDRFLAPADRPMHPISELSPVHCNDQMGIPGPWFERLPHFRMDFTPSSGDELQSELLIAREVAAEALAAVFVLSDIIAPVLQVCEVRTMAGDDFWLSPAYRRATVGIHFTWIGDWTRVRPVLAKVEAALTPFQPRPHWGKISTLDPANVRSAFQMANAFCNMAQRLDPTQKFRNDLAYRILGLSP
ncbi:MAG: FAD-binding protein [Fimbriimonadaceae bacterium]